MRHTAKTHAKIEQYRTLGYDIIEGNNRLLSTRKKYQGRDCVRLALTNSRRHGLCINTVWAVK